MNTTDKRLAEATKDLRQMMDEIAPFTKERDRRQYTTAGRWQDTRRAAATQRQSTKIKTVN
jgi:hypothetical protein